MEKKKHGPLFVAIRIVLIAILVILLVIISYVLYVVFSYHRYGDMDVEVKKNASLNKVRLNQELTMTTYNIGFGAYSDDFTFFMDSGIDKDGNVTKGKYGKARSKDEVQKI